MRHRLLPVARRSRRRRPGWPSAAIPPCPTTPASTSRCARPIRTAYQAMTARDRGEPSPSGMGIDKPDVRSSSNLDAPKTLEAYTRETGRAGRDGLPSEAFMLYGLETSPSCPAPESSDAAGCQKQIGGRKLEALVGYCETTAAAARCYCPIFRRDLTVACGNWLPGAGRIHRRHRVVRKALSCVYRNRRALRRRPCHRRAARRDTEKVAISATTISSTYGIGQKLSATEWRSVGSAQLVAMGLLVVDIAGHGRPSDLRAPTAGDVLRGERRVELRARSRAPQDRDRTPAAVRATRGMEGARRPRPLRGPRAQRMTLARPRACRPTSSSTHHAAGHGGGAPARPRRLRPPPRRRRRPSSPLCADIPRRHRGPCGEGFGVARGG